MQAIWVVLSEENGFMSSFQYLWWIFTIQLESFCQLRSHLKFWDNNTVVLHVDNQAVVYVISKNSFMQGPITLATHAMPNGFTSNTQHPFLS